MTTKGDDDRRRRPVTITGDDDGRRRQGASVVAKWHNFGGAKKGDRMATVSVFGGTGFLGRRLIERLASEGASVRVAVRHPDRARTALDAAGLEQVSVFGADVRDRATIGGAVAGADAVVNAVSAYVETGTTTFEAVHVRGAETLAREAAAAGVARFVLVSGLGADPESVSAYIGARGRGERAVQQAFATATIARPGAMFGPGDALFSTLDQLARLLPVLPLIGSHTRLQPVYVQDVAEAVARILGDPGTAGRVYELAGPTVYTVRELFEIALRIIGKRRFLMPIPLAVAEVQARLFELLPNAPLTTSQVDLLRMDNVASGTLPGLRELGIMPSAIETIVPTYLGPSRAAS
jgi:NADH dehydrogenase